MTRTPPSVDLALEAWRRRRWLALAVFAAAVSAAVTTARSLPNLYRATATVLVEQAQISDALLRPSITTEVDTRLQTIREDVMSRTRLTELIQRLNLYADLRPRVPVDALVARMRRDIDLDVKGVESPLSGRNSTIAFTISFTGPDADTTARVANELARMYVSENTSIREGQATRTAEFLAAQLAGARAKLDGYERQVNEFRNGHIGELPQQVEPNLASLERLNTQLRLNGDNQLRLLDRRDRLERQRAEAASARPPAPLSPDVERLATLQRQLADLRTHFTDAYPDVVRVKGDIDALTRRIADRSGAGPSPASPGSADQVAQLTAALADVETELQGLKADEQALRRTIATYEERVENAPKRQQELQELSRDYDTTKERYESLLRQYQDAQLAESLEQGQKTERFRVLDPALPPRDPVAPNRTRLLALGFLLACGLAFAAVVAAEKLDTAFHGIDDLRAFAAIPTLATVGLIPSRAASRQQRRRAALAAIAAALAMLLIVAGSRYLAHGNEQIVRMMDRSRG